MNLPLWLLSFLGFSFSCQAASTWQEPSTQRVDLVFQTEVGPQHFHVELANTNRSREQGLMNRTKIAADGGMLFVFDQSADHTFWMKNTPLSLDMIFVSEDFRVLGVLPKIMPLSLAGRHIGKPSRMVIELLSGTAQRLHIREGTRVEVVGGLSLSP